MSDLTPLEDQVVEMLVRGDDDALRILREQARNMHVTSRSNSGVGFFTEFEVSSGAPSLPGQPTFKIGDVNGTADNVHEGLGFLLYVERGVISMLEAYTYGESWPTEVRGLKLSYSNTTGRKLDFPAASTH
jgi:hypothetical protein